MRMFRKWNDGLRGGLWHVRSALEILEGQVALVHHIMAYEEANPAVHILKMESQLFGLFHGDCVQRTAHGHDTVRRRELRGLAR